MGGAEYEGTAKKTILNSLPPDAVETQIKLAFLMGPFTRGGAETLALDVCRNAANAGLDMVLFHRKGGILLEDFQNSGVEIIKLSPKSPFDVGYLARLRRRVKDRNIDILHAHQAIDAVYGLLATAGMRTKVVLSFHGHGFKGGLLGNGFRKFAIRRSDLIVFVSQELAAHYRQQHGPIPNGTVLHNGIDFGKFGPPGPAPLRDELSLEAGCLLLGAVGNFTAVRDQMTTCRFLNLLQKEGVAFHFVFVGGAMGFAPELYQQCVDYCQAHGLADRVSFLGQRSDVPAILPQLDAFVYSTVHDTFGIAVVEAIAAGIPVFVNDWGVMQEVTDGGNWATLYRSKDENDLLQRFLNFCQNREDYSKKAHQNARAVRERYGIKHYLDRLKAIYRSLLIPQEP